MSDEKTLVETWMSDAIRDGQSLVTVRRYRSAIQAFIGWYEEQNHEVFVSERLTPIDLTGYRNHLQVHAAASTVNVHVCALRSFSTWLTDTDRVTKNPALRLKSVGTHVQLAPKALTPSQVNALLREALHTRHPQRDYAVLQVLVQTGLRISECAALKLGDVQISERQGELIVRKGKGNKMRRVPLNNSARRALIDYLALRWNVAAEIKAVTTMWSRRSSSEPLWYSQKGGGQLSVRAMSAIVEILVEVCSHRNLVPEQTSAHTLRHTFATNYLKDHSGDLIGLAALLGHDSLETTRIYVQPSADDLAQRVEHMRLNAYSNP